jgi:hypothetical protein
MYGFLRNVVARLRGAGRGPASSPAARRVRPQVEGMEDRMLPSASPLLLGAVQPHPNHAATFQPAGRDAVLIHIPPGGIQPPSGLKIWPGPINLFQVPDLQGVEFQLTDRRGGTDNFWIEGESWNPGGDARIDGLFDFRTNTGIAGVATTGTLYYDAQFNLHITLNWSYGSRASAYVLQGTITGQPGQWDIAGAYKARFRPWRQFTGHEVTLDLPDLRGVNFVLTSPSKPDKTFALSFTSEQWMAVPGGGYVEGSWNGSPGQGDLFYDFHDNLHLIFHWQGGKNKDHTLDAIITGQPGQWHLDGDVQVVGGGGPGHVSGDGA